MRSIAVLAFLFVISSCESETKVENELETVGDSIETKGERLADSAGAKWERLENKVENRVDSMRKKDSIEDKREGE